jgi:hypothetical protein
MLKYCAFSSGAPYVSRSVTAGTRELCGDNRFGRLEAFNRRLTIARIGMLLNALAVGCFVIRTVERNSDMLLFSPLTPAKSR